MTCPAGTRGLSRWAPLLAITTLAAPGCRCGADPTSPLVQDFESRAGFGKWPGSAPGEVERSTDWKADGEASLRIDPGLLATIDRLHRRDFRGYDALRVHVHNTSDRLVTIGFELQDDRDELYDRHRSAFGAPPGDSIVDIDLTGGLWRGEENRPWRGSVKTPLDLGNISRVAFENRGSAPVYVDALTLVTDELPVPPGAFAFDFGRRGSRVMAHTTGIFEDTVFDPAHGFGFSSGQPTALGNDMTYPSPLLGDGLAWQDAVFQVALAGGKYEGWIGFERGGFWETESTGYSRAALLVNGAEVDSHTFSPAGPHFLFEDVEVTRMAEVETKLVWPAHAIRRFAFEARSGPNTFSLAVTDLRGRPLRVAGLFLAPDTPAGRDFIDAQEARQRRYLQAAFPDGDRARRPANAAPPTAPLVLEARPVGDVTHPRDLPDTPTPPIPSISAIAGHRAAAQLALYAPRDVDVSIVASLPADTGLPRPKVSCGVHGPKRPYERGAAWIETMYFRHVTEDETVHIGPDLARSILLEFDVNSTVAPQRTTLTLRISAGAELLAEVSIPIEVFAVDLPPLPIPVGLFMSALPFDPDVLGEERWWQLQEILLSLQGEAGLNTPTGGPGLDFTMTRTDGGYAFSGDRALRYVELAGKYGLSRAVVCYGSLLPSLKYDRPDPVLFQKSWADFESAHGLPPHYVNAYDEPGTDGEIAAVDAYLAPFHEAGVRTIGFLSHADGRRHDRLLDATYAPAVSGHTPDLLKRWLAEGKRLFLYNRGVSRLSMGADLASMIRLGVAGRLEWVGLHAQGFAFDDLDGREPAYGMFVVHDVLGIMPTPRWLSLREGLLDARIRLAVERALPPGEPGPEFPADYPADPSRWPDQALEAARAAALQVLVQIEQEGGKTGRNH